MHQKLFLFHSVSKEKIMEIQGWGLKRYLIVAVVVVIVIAIENKYGYIKKFLTF